MAVLTSHTLHENLPATELDWAGRPMPRGSAYGGRPEHQPKPQRTGAKSERTIQQLNALRLSMQRAREIGQARRRKAKEDAQAHGTTDT